MRRTFHTPDVVRRLARASFALLVVLVPWTAKADDPTIQAAFSSPPSPVGAGARATGVGSAFIGLADDATAASWNPGGLTQLQRPEMSVVGLATYDIGTFGDGSETKVLNDIEQTFYIDGQRDTASNGSLNYLSLAVPFSVADVNFVSSINYQQMLSFRRDTHYTGGNISAIGEARTTACLRQTGGVDAVTGSLAVELIPDLSLGASVNYWIDGLTHPYAWRLQFTSDTVLTLPGGIELTAGGAERYTYQNFDGLNGTFGMLWKAAPTISVGAVGKVPFTTDVSRVFTFDDPTSTPIRDEIKLHMPASYGLGVSWRPDDALTVSVDATYVAWGDFYTQNASGERFLVTGDPASEASVDGVFTERIGAEYLWNLTSYVLAARGGLFFDPQPSLGAPEPYYGGSVGLGLTVGSTNVDFAYQIRVGLGVNNSLVAKQIFAMPEIESDDIQNSFYLSVVQHF